MKRLNINRDLTEEERKDIDDMMDPFSFEKYCGSCDNFPGDDLLPPARDYKENSCPYAGKINAETEWKRIGCKCFWD